MKRSDGDYKPSVDEIKQTLFKIGDDSERYYQTQVWDNELVEQKCEGWELAQRYGNIFVEYETKYPGRSNWEKTGISITKSGHQFRTFINDKGEYLPFSFVLTTGYVLELVEKGLQEGWVRDTETYLSNTQCLVKGWVIPVVRIFQSFFLTTPDDILLPLLNDREKYQENKKKEGINRVRQVLLEKDRITKGS
jgi:hypothetical protein